MIVNCWKQRKRPHEWPGRLKSDVKLFSYNTYVFTAFLALLTSNFTLPSAVANKVWSRPIPTFLPAEFSTTLTYNDATC